ncbi:hypothetical protein OIU84_022300 [Salix udensis]|uniref:Phospholipase D n=1 Tax=Salix udensis TaxID=889485 RepID=A0AAD6KNR2_9ROSI|nr:hypothetical protein OIU84_022300 [Salix udensis]
MAQIDHTFSFGGSNHNQGQQVVSFPTNKGSLKVLPLHGNLEILVKEAKSLPNLDMFHKTLGDMFSKIPVKLGNKIEGHLGGKITSDPYVTISISDAVIARTFVINNNENPVWMQHFDVPVAHHAAEVHFSVKDDDIVGSQIMGAVGIPVQQLISGMKIEGIFPVIGSNGKPCKGGASLSLSIQFTPVEKMAIYQQGVRSGPGYSGVPGTYFPLRRGGKVTLYQDAHVHDGCLPDLKLDGDIQFEHRSCWDDICSAIGQARRLIYITGWSVYYKVKLVRDGNDGRDCTLGDLLRTKSQEGVRVLLLVWDDPSSKSILGIKTEGLMHTSDEETRRFFKHSSVQVLLCPRSAGKGHSFIKKQETETIYTHHQKTVIVDTDAGHFKRKITAFVGGLDLCKGRYDTPQHPLFRTLQTVHKDDFRNPNFAEPAGAGCPRQPWHDLHCQVDGPAAYDILTNFEERWLKASKPRGMRKAEGIERLDEILGIAELPPLTEDDPEVWNVQVFRSIDSNSVKGFPDDPKDATSMNLACGKNVIIDMSIHTAYVNAIRAAQHFIYIENQYFLGSSYNWDSHSDSGANNLIPMEIALKIAEKIRAHERFSAYILIPMWPEGVPTSAPIQSILFWQHKTMQMMYETIYKALVEVGLENTYEPQDYLNFFCLGNREALDRENGAHSSTPGNTHQARSEKSRRFMIYIHSKGIIADDEYQWEHINPTIPLARKNSRSHGQVYGYRMSLWAEHIGGVEECFEQPETIECVRRVRSIGEQNWRQYIADEVTEMRGHLLKYPVEVDRRGKVKALPGCEKFPDVDGKILGSFMGIQESVTM